MKIIKDKKNRIIASQVKMAETIPARLVGLMFVNEMKGYNGLMLEPCNSVHNFFVRFATDVVFLTEDNKIVKILRDFKPWRVSWIYFRARKVLELKAGALPLDLCEGDYLEVEDV